MVAYSTSSPLFSIGTIGQFTPFAPDFIPSSNNRYLNDSTFSTTLYDFGTSSISTAVSMGGAGTTATSVLSLLLPPCNSLTLILKTPTVYVDDSTIAVYYTAADAAGRLSCALGAGTVTIAIAGQGGTQPCTTTSFPNGLCTYTGASASLFAAGGNVVATVTFTNGATVVTQTTTVYFTPAPVAPASYDNLRGYVFLPKHPVYQGDTFTVDLQIYYPSSSTSYGIVDIGAIEL